MASARFKELLNLGARSNRWQPTAADWVRVNASHREMISLLETGGTKVYGVHTGYGANVLSRRDPGQWRQNQIDLLKYLQVGVGDTLPERVVRRALRLQLMKAFQGHSGIHPETLSDLIRLADAEIIPAVPCFGSLGASGDLIPMAHAIAPLFEKTEPRGPRDVIGLVNTNSIMASYAIELLGEAYELLDGAQTITALVMSSIRASDESVSTEVESLRRGDHGFATVAAGIRERLHSFRPDEGTKVDVSWLQPRYSVRCAPMILGNALDLLEFAERKILLDAESVADNPVFFQSESEPSVRHAGLFYAASTASAADAINDAIAKISELLDRQVLILMDPKLSEGLPENLAIDGLSHCKGLHQLISALNQQIRSFSVPSRSMSFSCESSNQDVVPCAMSVLNQLNSACRVAHAVARASAFVALRAYAIRCGDTTHRFLDLASRESIDARIAARIATEIKTSNRNQTTRPKAA